MRSLAHRRRPPANRPRYAVLPVKQPEAGLASRSCRAAACAGVSAGIGAAAVCAIGRASMGEQFILWVLLVGWLAYWLFDQL